MAIRITTLRSWPPCASTGSAQRTEVLRHSVTDTSTVTESHMKTTRTDWLVPAALIALSLVPALAGTARVAGLLGGAPVTPENARFFAMPLPVLIHIPAAIIYSIVGAFQFSPGFRRRNRKWHRGAGKLLLLCGTLVALSGLWMAHFYAWPKYDGVA